MIEQGREVAADGFFFKDGLGRIGSGSGVQQEPVALIRISVLKIRRNGGRIVKTHIEELLEGVFSSIRF